MLNEIVRTTVTLIMGGTQTLRLVCTLCGRRGRRVVGLHARFCEIQRERSERAKNAGCECRDLGAILLGPRLCSLVHAEEEDAVALGAVVVAALMLLLNGQFKACHGGPCWATP